MSAIQSRYEFVYLFDVANGNPNGDPDAGNLPRLDPETSQGLVSDVCLKRKIRNYVELAKGGEPGFNIYVQERAILNERHQRAYKALGLQPEPKKLPKDEAKARELTAWMCLNYYDIRTFGAVMTTKTNCGQVRGPVQLAFARSIEPVVPLEISITRMAITDEGDIKGDIRTMGRKHIVPYGLYRAHGFISAKLAEKTGFSDADLTLLWEALLNMFEHDRSAAHGEMNARKLIVFKHDSALGNAPAHKLFEVVGTQRRDGGDGPARRYEDYNVTVLRGKTPAGIEVLELL